MVALSTYGWDRVWEMSYIASIFWMYLSFGGGRYFLRFFLFGFKALYVPEGKEVYILVANNQTAQTVFIYTYVRVQLIACLSRLSNLCQKGQICYFKE